MYIFKYQLLNEADALKMGDTVDLDGDAFIRGDKAALTSNDYNVARGSQRHGFHGIKLVYDHH